MGVLAIASLAAGEIRNNNSPKQNIFFTVFCWQQVGDVDPELLN